MKLDPAQTTPRPGGGSPMPIEALLAVGGPEDRWAVVDLLPIGVLFVSGDSAENARVVHANPAFCETVGCAPEPGSLYASLPCRFYLPDRRTPLPHADLPNIRAISRGEAVRDVELHLLRPDGTWRILLDSASPMYVDGRVTGAVAIVQDITALRQAHAALEESAAELAAIYENAPVVLLLVDAERRVRKANRGAERFAGVSAETMLGRCGGEALRCLHALADERGCGFGPRCRECAVRLTVLDTLATGRSHPNVEVTLPFLHEGTPRDLTFLLSTTGLSIGGQPHVLVALQDITELRRASERARYLASFPRENPNPVLEVGLDGAVAYANPAAERLFPDLVAAGWRHPFLQGIEALVAQLQGEVPTSVERDVRCGDRVFFQAIHYLPERRVLRLYCRDVTERHRAEEERDRLQRERERHRQLLEAVFANTPAGIAVLSGPEHRHTLVNRAQMTIARGKGPLLGRTVAEVWPEARDHEAQRLITRVYESGEGIHLEEVRMLLERGEGPEEAFFNLDYVPLRGEDGTVTDVILFAHEITDLVVSRRRAEIMAETLDAANEQLQAQSEELRASNEELQVQSEELQAQSEELRIAMDDLRESEQRLRAIIDSADGFVWLKDPDGRFLVVNAYTARLLGRPPEEIIGRTVFDLFPQDRAREYAANDRQVLAAGRTMEFEEAVDLPDGRHTYLAVKFPLLDAKNRPYAVGAVCTDITERRRIEEARARMAAILDATSDFVGTADLNGRALTINAAGRRMLGVGDDEDVAGQEIRQWHPAWAWELLTTEGIPAALRDGVWTGETALLSREGREIPVSQLVLAHKGSDGTVAFLSTIARDIGRQKQLEEELRQAQKMEAVGRLAGGVAHDFNNMLMPIMVYSQLLCDSLEPGTRAHRRAVAIASAAERAADLPRQLLAFSRKQIIQPRPLDLNASLAAIETMLRRLIGEDILLIILPGLGLGKVLADPSQVDQVILNLVVNARDAMPDGGEITIETRNVDLEDAAARQLAGVKPGRYVMLAVSDTGHGMDKETQSRIFESFFTTKEQGRGTGLGLSTVYGIVKQSGGDIRVHSEPGRGTTFRIYLPRVDQQAEAAGRTPGPADLPRGAETILLAEDEESVREAAQAVLEEGGYTVIAVGDGSQALLAARRSAGPIHLLLTDVVMPGMSGRQLADALVAERPGIRVVYMSGYTEDAIVSHGIQEDSIAFVQKPFTPGVLLRKVREVLDRPSTASP